MDLLLIRHPQAHRLTLQVLGGLLALSELNRDTLPPETGSGNVNKDHVVKTGYLLFGTPAIHGLFHLAYDS